MLRIVQLGGLQHVEAGIQAARDDDRTVGQHASSDIEPRDRHRLGRMPTVGDWIVNVCAGQPRGIEIRVGAAGDQHASILQTRRDTERVADRHLASQAPRIRAWIE